MPTPTIPFEILGHFEEIIDQETGKCYGTRPKTYCTHSNPELYNGAYRHGKCLDCSEFTPPAYGYAGRVECLYTRGFTIQIDKAHKGMQPYKFKADAKCWIITHPICGRMKKDVHV